MKEEFWDEDARLKDMLFTTNDSAQIIGEKLGLSAQKVNKRIKQLGLTWVKKNNRKLSRGHAALTDLMQRLLPGEDIVNEYHIGERLMLDIYCPKYRLAAEYHGKQHFFYTEHFHKNYYAFKASQDRDNRKIELCKEQGIALVIFKFTDDLTESLVFDRMLEAIKTTPHIEKEPSRAAFKGNHYYEKMKAKQREYRKQKYREYKRWRDTNGK